MHEEFTERKREERNLASKRANQALRDRSPSPSPSERSKSPVPFRSDSPPIPAMRGKAREDRNNEVAEKFSNMREGLEKKEEEIEGPWNGLAEV